MRIPMLLVAWIAFIFGTSCTVIRPQEFFELIGKFSGAGEESMRQFAVFWGLSWFVIVKGWHFIEFVILTLLAVGVVKWWRGVITSKSIIAAMLFCIAFAVSDEWHQSFIPDRYGTIQDVVIDGLGVCTAGAILLVRQKRLEAKNAGVQIVDG